MAIITWYLPDIGWIIVKCAVIVSDVLMEISMASEHLSVSSGERDRSGQKGDKIWQLAQKDNNCISVRVTLRCGLLFASSVITGQSQGSLTNDYVTRGGDGTLSQGLSQQYTTSHGTCGLNQRSDYYLQGPNKADAVFSVERQKTATSFCLLLLFSQAFAAATSQACLLGILLTRQLYRGASVLWLCEPPKYLHAESQLHSMGRKTSKDRVQNKCIIGLSNHPDGCRSLLVPGAAFVFLAEQTFKPRRLCSLMMSRIGFGCAEMSGANS